MFAPNHRLLSHLESTLDIILDEDTTARSWNERETDLALSFILISPSPYPPPPAAPNPGPPISMPLFRRKDKSKPSFSSSAFRSVEHLPHTGNPPSRGSSAAPHFDSDDSSNNNNYQHQHQHQNNYTVSTPQQFPPQTQPQAQTHPYSHAHSHSQSQFHSSDPRLPPPRNPARSSGLQRSHTQRLRTPPDASTLSNSNSTVTVVNNNPSSPSQLAPPQSFDADVSDQSWPSSPTDKPDDQEPRRSKRSLFSFHSSTSSSSVRDQPSLLERNRSVKLTGRRQSGQVQHQQQPQQQQLRQQQSPQLLQQSRSSLEGLSKDYVVDSPGFEQQLSMPQQSTGRVPDPGLAPHTRSPHPSPIPRSNTDPHLSDQVYRQQPAETPRQASDLAHYSHQLDPRPPSRQSLGPPSPFPYTKSETSSVSQLGAMSDRPTGGNQQNQSQPPGSSQGNNAGQQQGALDTGRSTPTSKDNRSRDDENDFRALLQKHEELRKSICHRIIECLLLTDLYRGQIFQGETILL